MPKGDWFSYLALGLIAGLGLALVYMTSLAFMNGYLVSENPYGSSEQHQGNLNKGHQDHGYVEPFGQATGDDIRKLEARENPDDAKYYEEQDRRAQKSAADAAQVMVFLTEVSIILGLVGAGAIIWTLTVSREANSISRETAERQLRAYLSVFNFDSVVTDKPGPDIRVKVTFKNTGQTPAQNVRVNMEWELAPPPFDEAKHFAAIVTVDGRGSVGPGMSFFAASRTNNPDRPDRMITRETLNDLVDGNLKFWIFGVIEYQDAFRREQRTRFRYVMTLTPNDVGFSPCEAGNEET